LPSLSQHQSNDFVKLLLLGDSKAGKTGSLVSLVKAGYRLRILDFDNLLDVLKFFILEECPDKIDNVEVRTLRDKRVASPLGPIISGTPQAFPQALRMLDRWKYTEDGVETDLGPPAQWGAECILVLDSLSRFCDAAFDFRDPLTPTGKSGEKDTRATYGDAQDAVENVLAMLTSKSFATNVIVIAHGTYTDLPDGTKKIFPQGVGQKLSPKIPQYFPTYIRYKNIGGNRVIQTVSDAMIDLANPRPFAIQSSYNLKTGLAEIFAALRQPQESQPREPIREVIDPLTPPEEAAAQQAAAVGRMIGHPAVRKPQIIRR